MLAAVGCGEYPDVETAAAKIVSSRYSGPDEELTANMKNVISSSESSIQL